MISIDQTNPESPMITFESRKGHKRQFMSVPLISAHFCPVCNNIVQATFNTDSSIDTYIFEEVNILKLEGEDGIGSVVEVLPNDKHKRKTSCYNSSYDVNLKYQKIVLKNHLLKMKAGVNKRHNGEHIYETGLRPCFYSGLYSLNEEVLAKDFLFFSGQDMDILKGKKAPSLDFLAPLNNKDDGYYKRIPAIGKGPGAILVRTKQFIYGYSHYFESQLNTYLKTIGETK